MSKEELGGSDSEEEVCVCVRVRGWVGGWVGGWVCRGDLEEDVCVMYVCVCYICMYVCMYTYILYICI